MKITYFKAKNFIGIYAGTGRNEIEIDFEKNNINDIILLLGDNGSGKSTLMSIANPFRETFDCRKNIILPEKEGYKEIHLKDGNDKYVIVHYYGKTSSKNKSYISKNGVELNENGNIGSFTDTLMEKFNLTKDYFTIGKVGSNVEGFIGLSTANRKSYINKFIPNIDEYLEAFEVVNDKYKQYNKDIKSLKSSLDKMDEDDLLVNKSQIETNIKLVTSEIKRCEKDLNTIDINILNIKESIKDIPEDIKKLYLESKKEYEQEKLKYNGYLAKYPKLANYDMKSINEKVTENRIVMNDLKNDLDNLFSEISSVDNGITSNELEKVRFEHLKNEIYENFIEPSKIKVDIFNDNNNLKAEEYKLDGYKAKLDEYGILEFAENNEYSVAKSEVDTLLNTIKNIKDSYSLDTINNTKIEDKKKYSDRIVYLQKINESIDKDLNLIKQQIFYIENNHAKYESIYSKKPDNCNVSDCPFIKDAEHFMLNEYPKLEGLIKSEMDGKNTWNANNTEINELNESYDYICNIEKYIINYIDDYKFINLILDFSDINTIMSSTGLGEEKLYDLLTTIKNFHLANDEIERLNLNIERNKSLLEINEQKEKLINEYNGNICALDNHSNQLQDKLDKLYEDRSEKEREMQIKKNTNKLFDIFSELINNFQDKSKTYEVYNEMYTNSLDKLEEIDKLENSIILVNKEKLELDNKLESLSKDIEKVKNELFLFKTYSDKLKEIESVMQELELVKEALDPKKGIPLIFMTNYLNVIGATANELLDKAYGGDFKIAFDVTPKDFMINVYKSDGTKLNDISEASQGEISLTTIALSLAMIENLLKDCKYNILYLDEVDATLSTTNRRIFLELLKIQMEKNIEQCFVISHNDEFYSHPIDLILFKGNKIDKDDSELMDNKNIIWELV